MPTLLLVARSAAASGYEDAQFWRACSARVQGLVASASMKELAQFIEAMAEAGRRDGEIMYKVGDAVVARSSEMDTDDVASVLRAHMLLTFHSRRALLKLQDTLFDHMKQSLATAAGLAVSFRCLAQLCADGALGDGAELPPDLVQAANRMVVEHIGFFSTPQLCAILDAQVILGMRGDRQTSSLLAAIGGSLLRDAPNMPGDLCSDAVRGFAKCRVHDERLLTAVAARLREKEVRATLTPEKLSWMLYGFAHFSCQDTALLDLLAIEGKRCLHEMDVPLMSRTLAAIGKCGITSLVLTNRAAVQLRRFEPEAVDAATSMELSALAMAFGKLQCRDERLFDTFAESFLRRSQPALSEESADTLVNIVHAFTKVHCFHPGLFGAVSGALIEGFDGLSLKQIVKYLHAVAKVEYLPPPALQRQLADTLQAQRVAQLGVFDLLKLAAAVQRLGLQVPSLDGHVAAVLPNEPSEGLVDVMGQGNRASRRAVKRRKKSTRKRKWTW